MEIEKREIRVTVNNLEELCKKFGNEREALLGYYKESAGFEGWTNYETFIAYKYICDDENLISNWGPKAKNLLNESVFRTYSGNLNPYEIARDSLAEAMKEYFIGKAEEKWTLEIISKELLKGAYEVVNWYELVDVLMEEFRPSMVAEPPEQSSLSPPSNVVPLLPAPLKPKGRRPSRTANGEETKQ